MICMAQMIAHIGNLAPWNVGLSGLFTVGNVSRRFADHFEKALERSSADPIFDQVIEALSMQEHAYVGDGLLNVAKAQRNSIHS